MNNTRVPDLPPGVEEDSSVDVIYHNMNHTSDFRTWRTTRFGDVKSEMVKLTRCVENRCFDELISVAASKHSFVVVLTTTLTKEELRERGFPS